MKLRVGLLNDSFAPMIDGVAVATKAYGDIIKQKHGEPIVIVPKYPNIIDDYDYKVYRYHSVPSDKLIGYRAGNPFSPTLVNRLRNERMDLLHVHCPFASAVMARVICSSAKSKVPMVFTYHTKFNTDIKTRVKIKQIQKIAHRFVLNNINHMDEVWVVSKNAGEDLREFGYKGNYRIMRNGTDYEKGKSPKERIDEIDRIYRIEPCELVFLFVGRMMWYKNIRLMLDTYAILKQNGMPFKAFFIHSGSADMAADAAGEYHFDFLGLVNTAGDYTGGFDCFRIAEKTVGIGDGIDGDIQQRAAGHAPIAGALVATAVGRHNIVIKIRLNHKFFNGAKLLFPFNGHKDNSS